MNATTLCPSIQSTAGRIVNVDLTKSVFALCVADAHWRPLESHRLSRAVSAALSFVQMRPDILIYTVEYDTLLAEELVPISMWNGADPLKSVPRTRSRPN